MIDRYWALWLASILFRVVAALSLLLTIATLISDSTGAQSIAATASPLIPEPRVLRFADGSTNEQLVWISRLGIGLVYAIGFYAVGQACSLLLDMRLESAKVNRWLVSRLGTKKGQPDLDLSAPSSPDESGVWRPSKLARPMNRHDLASARYMHTKPEVTTDEPRRVHVYTKPVHRYTKPVAKPKDE